jgi:hypothetical protein
LTPPANVCAKMFKVFLVSRLLLSWCRMCHKHSHMSVRIQADLRPSFLWQVSLVRANMCGNQASRLTSKIIRVCFALFSDSQDLTQSHRISEGLFTCFLHHETSESFEKVTKLSVLKRA